MQNIDPIYFLFPVAAIAFSFGLVIYWHYRRSFSKWVLLYSFVAYFGAIALKYIVQIPTLSLFEAAVGGNPSALGIYYGLQTVVFEVGGAYLVAYFAIRRNHLKSNDSEGYGLGLALWENGVYIGILTLINFISYYAILSSGSGSLAQLIYNVLLKNSPGLFFPPSQALPIVGLDILERVSSLLVHFSWGYLCLLAVVFRRKALLAIALPMGLIDFLVPFAKVLGVAYFELVIFVLSVLCLATALASTRKIRKSERETLSTIPEYPRRRPQSLAYVNFRRSISYGKIYLVIGVAISLLFGVQTAALHGIGGGANGAPLIVSELPALTLPLFAVIGSMGGLMIFASDKVKGVYEYLIAYGVETSSIFWSIVLATAGLVSIILVISLSSTIGILLATGASISFTFVELVIFYAVPISYTSTMFMSMVGMIWSSLSTRRTGVNSPVGVAPVIGIAPIMAVLLLSSRIGSGYFILLVGIVSLTLLVLVGVMIVVSNKKMARERFLSNA